MNTIADRVSACLQEFNSLCSSPTIWTDSIPDEGTQSDISLVKLQNELSRFKIWSGNIGAHRKGRSSLDHRLRDASNIRDQVVELLEDLRESLQDAKDILTGQTTPWDQDLSPADFSDSDSDQEPFQDGASGNSELSQIFAAIVEDINCLFRLSVSIHNPSPHDRFKKACLTDTSCYEPFDVQHVCNKLSKAPRSIAERLGKAISRRRQYFKYRELHHDKLASGLELDDKDQMQSTVASSLPKKLNVNDPISLEENVDDASDAGRSQTSWATSAANPERRKIPALPAGAENGPFECPFCFMMVSIASRNHWKKHVFSDLFPYICIELGCPAPDQDFQRRHQWADHVKKHHWKTWACKLGCDKTFHSSQDIKRHLEHKHSETAEMTHLDSLVAMCERPKPENEPTDCPLCNERQYNFKQYHRHVGRHQEDLALFALPHLPGEEDEKKVESDSESESEGQEAMDSEVQDELEKTSSYVTRLSNENGDEAADAAERSPRYSSVWHNPRVYAIDSIGTNSIINGVVFRPKSRPWKCPVLSCQYHDYGWSTEEERDHHYSDKHSETPVENTSESFNPAHFDILHLHHKKSIYTFEFPRHEIRDGRLQVSDIRDLAAGLTFVPESFRHLVELSCKDTKLLIDGTPIRNYGILSGDTIKVESPQFRKSDPLGGSPSKDTVLDNGHGTEGNMELEGKAERDKHRIEFYQELRQRATLESSSDQVPVPKSESDLELRDNLQASAPGQQPKEVDNKVEKYPRPGVRCPMCAAEHVVVWVIPGRCCGYCGTPCADEDTPEPQDLSRATGGNDDAEARLVSVFGQRRFACRTCGKSFSRAYNRRRHEKDVHARSYYHNVNKV
ncbi:hypothetical protein FOQG_10983 [Fusarium oxysporum f. sp. raphani 54005]|uniref:C2H2-type domain-containing protein n=2 Tax=Fusarium oxysporum f. sp. raphani TaxID=96318 RepID=X0C2N9_FUSOX|nr:hypothetical protein FOQG_10983 [Fusarium oxysporum f. sp. raphani 54005]KAG7432292.1 Zinc finger transcription factor ace1 [Fusarium oxysporum f. sp. raphani]